MSKKEAGYLQKDAAKITKHKPQTIAYYTNKGIVPASISPGTGRGSNRLYSKADLIKFLLIRVLSDCGLSLEKIKAVFLGIKVDNFIKLALKHFDPNQSDLRIYIKELKDSKQFEKLYDKEPEYKPTDKSYILRIVNVHDAKKIDPTIDMYEKDVVGFYLNMTPPKTTSCLVINITDIFKKIVSL